MTDDSASTGHRWQRLEALFHAALPLPPDARASLLDRECRGDPALRAEVERLLAAQERAGGFIQVPAVTLADLEPEESVVGRRVGAYRVASELGRGGMGAVYLAERADGGFSQRVAIKLIKRGMDTDHVLARFRAERQILASLDHPNIARLLDGGSTPDGLPYLVMDYVDGQPIDEFADAHTLSIAERIRLFLQVCSAVSYAHEQGVVHRDIKPLNILVTPAGVPKLLDFGIAKVLLDPGEDSTSTVTGLRLLTPEYASPEQVEGRHATAASDVYSLGVVLYELLTGRLPYRFPSRAPQDVAATVCTTEPERPSSAVTRGPDPTGSTRRHRRESGDHAARSGAVTARQLSRLLRGDLDTIVLAALRKESARRYSSVAALADDLRRYLDGRPVLARSEGVFYRAAKFVRRNRAAVAVAGIAAVSVAVLAAVALPIPRGEDEPPSLLSTHALAERDRILVADFTDRTGDTTLAAALTEAFRTDLAQSPVVRVLTPRQVRASLELMQRPSGVVLDDTLAREIALREGVKAFVSGSLARLAGAYIVTVQLVSAREGDALVAIRETAPDSSDLITAVDRASKTLRRRIGESLEDLERMPSLEQVTTASLPALRLYSEAQQLVRQGRRPSAIDRFEAAIGLDTGFASAYVGLAMAYGSEGDIGRAMAAGDHALANRTRLSFVERSFLVGSTAHGTQDYPAAISTYTGLLERYPDNVAAMNNLALAYREARQYARAESLMRRAADTDSTIANFYFGMHGAQALQGHFARARATLDTVARRFPDNPVRLTVELQDAAARQDWRGAVRVARERIAQAGSDTAQLVDPYEALAGIAMTRGQVKEAERLWRRHLALSRSAGMMGRHLFGVVQLGTLEFRYRGDTARAVALVDSALRVTPIDSLLPGDRNYYDLARFYLAAGRAERARPLLAAAAKNDSVLGRSSRVDRGWAQSLLALAEGRSADALEELRQAAEAHSCTICVYPDLGRAYEMEGRQQDAARTYEYYLTTPWLWRYEPDAVELGWTTLRLGELQERLGRREDAVRTYTRLLRLWDESDPPLRQVLEDVRARVASLTGDAGSVTGP